MSSDRVDEQPDELDEVPNGPADQAGRRLAGFRNARYLDGLNGGTIKRRGDFTKLFSV